MKLRYNCHAHHIQFEKGDLVYVSNPTKKSKFSASFKGPYVIQLITPQNTAILQDPETHKRLKNLVHFNRLKYCYLRETCQNNSSDQNNVGHITEAAFSNESGSEQLTLISSQDTSSSDDQYLVEKIIRGRFKNNREEYLVKWVGYAASHNQYILFSELNEEAQQYVRNNHVPMTGRQNCTTINYLRSMLKQDHVEL